MSKLWKNIGWGTAKIGAGIGGGLLGGPAGGALAVSGVTGLQAATDKDKQWRYRHKTGGAILEDALSIGGGALGGAAIAKQGSFLGIKAAGAGTNSAMSNTGTTAITSSGSNVVSKSYTPLSTSMKYSGSGINPNVALNSTKLGIANGATGVNSNLGTPMGPYSGTGIKASNSFGSNFGTGIKAPNSFGSNFGQSGVYAPKEGMSKFAKGMMYANIGKAALGVGLSIKGMNDLSNMKAPSIAPPPMVKPEYTPDTVSSTQAAETQNIETALANKKKTDLATGRADSSEDAILEMTANNNLAATIEQGRTQRNQTINDNQFRADVTNQGMIANVDAANANMSANFESMRGGIESELLNTAMNAPFAAAQSILGTSVTEANRKDSLINALATAEPKEKEYILTELKKLGYNA